ncbi:glycosyltransferase family 4 protein [bacterium]|nr:glycosyltransferase family 4 protein [bacterium]
MIKIAYIGRLIKSKGINEFLNYSKKFPNKSLKYFVAGCDPIKSYRNLKKGNHNIVFLGNVRNVSKLLNSIDIVIFPSTYGEGYPRIILECISTNTYCIVYNAKWNLLDKMPQNVYCTNKNNIMSIHRLVEKILNLLKKNVLHYGVNKIVNQEHLQERIVNIYINIYKNINK